MKSLPTKIGEYFEKLYMDDGNLEDTIRDFCGLLSYTFYLTDENTEKIRQLPIGFNESEKGTVTKARMLNFANYIIRILESKYTPLELEELEIKDIDYFTEPWGIYRDFFKYF